MVKKKYKIMFGYFLLNSDIYICIQALYLLFFSVILNEKILYFNYRFNMVNFANLFAAFTLFYAILILSHNLHYEAILLNYQLVCDNLSFFFKFMVLFLSFLCILFSLNYCKYENIKTYEYLILLLLAIVGLLTIISSYDLITMYLAIELQSLCFYIITNLKFYSNFSIEAGLKYFILGALSSGILLFGSSLLYGFTGLTNFLDLSILLYYYNMGSYPTYYYESALIGIIFIYSGILFKIGAVPFHMWMSDIYEGSPTNITIFFAVVPQISIISLILRLNIIFVYTYLNYLYIFFICISILSIIIGTLGAIYQTKIKRLLAYSSISNMGYIISILATTNVESVHSVIFYTVFYSIITLGIWLLLLTLRNRSNYVKLKDISELFLLFKSNKYLAIILYIFLFSAMGVPPLLGFFNKLYIFMNIIELKMYFFAFFLIIFSSISVIYYLRLLKLMFSNVTTKCLFLVDMGELKALALVLFVYVNIYFFLYPAHISLLFYNLILFIFF